jgi:tRNA (guanine-N7-)-methyltransferase
MNGVDFKFIAVSSKENRILVTCENKDFFLITKNKNGNILIKVDNITRVSPVNIVKKALKVYSESLNAKVLFSNINDYPSKLKPKKQYLKDIEYFVNEFKTKKEILIEIGFGSGRHLLHQALKNPDKLIIGVEIHTPSIEQVLKQINLQNIKNILIINYDARLFLEFLQSNSVSQIFIHFPVPWDKKPQRRVISIEFIQESLRVLKIDGTLELRTDSKNYYEYSKKLLKRFKDYPTTIIKNQNLEITSKYEDRWKKMGKDIWDIVITSTIKNKQITLDKNFDFNTKINIDKISFTTKPIVKKDFFVHFKNIFKINNNDILIQLTMGNFNKPINKYILIQDNQAKYFQGDPIPTSANLKAHNLIKELLK